MAILGFLLLASTGFAAVQPLPPMPPPEELSAAARRDRKPAVGARELDGMESLDAWTLSGPGRMSLTTEAVQSGENALRLTSPTKLDRPGPTQGRPFAETGVRRRFAGEDWSGFNRLVFHVRPHLPGFRTISLVVKFHAAGSDRWLYTFGHLHYFLLQPDRWNRVVWEIPHLPRTNVMGLEFTYRLQGHEPGATDQVQFDFDDLRLERVDAPDPWRGWEVSPGDLAYSHLGYAPDSAKSAIAPPGTGSFEVVPADGGEPVFRGTAQPLTNALGAFAVLDFTELRRPGRYRLRAGAVDSPPFPIGPDPWEPALVASLNHYRCQRCGEAVPGIHDACHQDWQVRHADRRLPLHGGWHDAGDLSQGIVNTAEATDVLLSLGAGLRTRRHPLGVPLLAEARRGRDWLQRTRFGDGYRAVWGTLDYWTDGVLGNADDTVATAGNGAFDNLVALRASARAARVLRAEAPAAAAESLRLAVEDWRFARAKEGPVRTETVAAAIRAGAELYRATGQGGYRDQAVELARVLLSTQQTKPPPGWRIPLAGYFHASPDRRRPLTYEHRGHHESPVVALVELATLFPDHPDAGRWREAVRLHADYLRRTAELSAPWRMPAAGIYDATAGDPAYQRQVREGLALDDRFHLRRFPVWHELRGNSGVLLSQARALASAARLLRDPELAQLARTQLEWHLGRNPFAQSLMYGIGHNFTPQYSAMSGNIVGGLPVGIQTRTHEDVPYWPASNCYNYAEIWVHPTTRFLEVLDDLLALAPPPPPVSP